MTAITLATVFKAPDGSPTFGFWWDGAVCLLLISLGLWGVVAPQSLRRWYFGVIRSMYAQRGRERLAPTNGFGWGSSLAIRLGSGLSAVIGLTFITWMVFFTRPGVAY